QRQMIPGNAWTGIFRSMLLFFLPFRRYLSMRIIEKWFIFSCDHPSGTRPRLELRRTGSGLRVQPCIGVHSGAFCAVRTFRVSGFGFRKTVQLALAVFRKSLMDRA